MLLSRTERWLLTACLVVGLIFSTPLETWLHRGPIRAPWSAAPERAGETFGLRLSRGMVFRPLSLRTSSTISLRIGGSTLLRLTATTIVISVVSVTVGAPFLLLCHSLLPVRSTWATTRQISLRVTTITFRVTEALAGFTLYETLGSLVSFDCHSDSTERRHSAHVADNGIREPPSL